MRLNFRLMFAAALLAAAALACNAGGASTPQVNPSTPEVTVSTPEVKLFTSDTGGFSIAFPIEPKESTQTISTAAGDVELITYTATDSSGTYMVGTADYPADMVAKSDPEKMLDGGRDGAVKNINGKLISEEHIKLDGNPGRELVIDSADGKNRLHARFYLVKNRLYQILFIVTPGGLSDDAIKAFLDSFSLNP